MKILLVGEYSGLHTYLTKGLIELGHKVHTISDGDGFKNFPRDIDIAGSTTNKYLYTIGRFYKEWVGVNSLDSDYDIVQFMNPIVFSRFGLPELLFDRILKRAPKSFLLAAGDDSYYWNAYRQNFYKYSTHKNTLEIDEKSDTHVWESNRLKSLNKYLVDRVTGIIPCATEYRIAYSDQAKLMKLIPFPINIQQFEYQENIYEKGSKIKILHGVITGREGFKGSNLINTALKKIVDKYPNDVTYINTHNLPFAEYKEIMKTCHVVIDQANSYCPGMNALTAMAFGKVVMGGAEEEYLLDIGISSCPIINIQPDVDHIYEQVKWLLDNRENITDMGKLSRDYVENYHDYKKVAARYIDAWSK